MSSESPKLHKDIPAEVQVGIVTFSVEPWYVPLTENAETWGETCFDEQTIRINQNLPRHLQVMVFWHELFHIFLEQTGLSWLADERLEEGLACGFGYFMANMEGTVYRLASP